MANFLNSFLAISDITEIDIVSVLEGTDKPTPKDEIQLMKPILNASAKFHYIHDAAPIKAIDHYIEGNEIEILCTVKHHQNFLYRLFFNSRTKALANKALTTILVLHD
jgi:citrate synthase